MRLWTLILPRREVRKLLRAGHAANALDVPLDISRATFEGKLPGVVDEAAVLSCENGSWKYVRDLAVGDRVLTTRGDFATILRLESMEASEQLVRVSSRILLVRDFFFVHPMQPIRLATPTLRRICGKRPVVLQARQLLRLKGFDLVRGEGRQVRRLYFECSKCIMVNGVGVYFPGVGSENSVTTGEDSEKVEALGAMVEVAYIIEFLNNMFPDRSTK